VDNNVVLSVESILDESDSRSHFSNLFDMW